MSKYCGCIFIGHAEGLKTTLADYFEHEEVYHKLIDTVDELYINNKQEELKELYKTQNEIGKRYVLNHIILLNEKREYEELMESINSMSEEVKPIDPVEFDNHNDNLTYKNNIHTNNNIYHPNQKVKTKKRYTRRLP